MVDFLLLPICADVMIYDVKPNICICTFVSKGRFLFLSFVLEIRRRVLCFSKYYNNLEVLPRQYIKD